VSKEKNRTLLFIKPRVSLGRIKKGDSVAVDGVCLTVVTNTRGILAFEVMTETLKKTIISAYTKYTSVNLEPALRLTDFMGGHMVQGHVDDTGKIVKIISDKKNCLVYIKIPSKLLNFIVLHGSVALDGVSLTVANIKGNLIMVSLITETLMRTNWKKKVVGQKVNVEVDIIAKYIAKFFHKK
jgi:riboflavin synthase